MPAVALDDVLVGDVWVASGQSNMEFAMRQAATAASGPAARSQSADSVADRERSCANIRRTISRPRGWAASTPETAKDFSAVAWYFAREIEQREHVPVGVIDSTWGGTVAEAWTRMAALGEDAALAPVFVHGAR